MAKAEKITVKTSGRTFTAVLDSQSEAYPKGLKLPEPTFGKLGRGTQYRFEVTPTVAGKLVSFLRTQADKNLAKGVTPDQREDGYAIKYDLEKLEKQLADLQADTAGTDAG